MNERPKFKLPARDWILLPLLAVLTVSLILLTAEWIALRLFADPPAGNNMAIGDCLTDNGPVVGLRGIPNTVCHGKLWESDVVDYNFNSCGDRDPKDCHEKPADTYRIVLLGTSTALGWSVPRDKSFAALLPGELSRKTGRNIDVYNESMMFQSLPNVLSRFDEIIAAKPDMILLTFPPIEPVQGEIKPDPPASASHRDRDPDGMLAMMGAHVRRAFSSRSPLHAVYELLLQVEDSRIRFMLLHALNESQTHYVSSYLEGSEASFLKTDTYSKKSTVLNSFEQNVAEIAARSKAAGVPLVVVMLPFRAQIAMISMGDWPEGYDPYKLDSELRNSVERDGGTYISILSNYRNIANPERSYFPVDGHPMIPGHATLARLLANELTNGSVPALKANSQPMSQRE